MLDTGASMNLASPILVQQRYELRKQAWHDGSHAGWIALDRHLEREVLFRVPYGPAHDQWFVEISRLRSRLCHTNLIPLYDVGTTEDGRPFSTEPHIKAMFMSELLRNHLGNDFEVPLSRLVSYLLDVCKAIAYLHENVILHLDLYPGNVLVDPRSHEVFATVNYCSPLPSRQGRIMGRVPYMAPEQANPERMGAPDIRTDVYGLGRILFEILFGNPPNEKKATPKEDVTALATRKGPPPRRPLGARAARYPELAKKLEPICRRALESDRNARQANMYMFMKDVEECLWACE